jgi:hypothetical protein
MKKLGYYIAVVILLLGILPYQASASPITESEEIIRLENGDYITVEFVVIDSRAASTKTGQKSYVYKNNNGTEQWRATLSGTFTYTGTTATCTSSGCTTSVSNSAWYEVSRSAGKSGSSATAEVTMGEKFLGITINKESISMKLTCSPTGTLS